VLSALVLLATVAAVAINLVRSILFRLRKKRRRAFTAFRSASVLALIYMFVLIVVSMTSTQRVLSTGVPKCFGDWCVTVTQAVRDRSRGVVELSLRNQGNRAGLRPDRPAIWLSDPKGRRVAPAAETGPPLGGPLRPDQTVEKEYQFDIPKNMQFPMVSITEGGWLTRFLIGDENSFLHPQAVTPLE